MASLVDRRRFLSACAAAGVGGLFPGTLWALASQAAPAEAPAQAGITKAMIAEAARLAGIELPDDVRDAMMAGLASALDDYEAIRRLGIPNAVAPAFAFEPRPHGSAPAPPGISRLAPIAEADAKASRSEDDLAFAGVRSLAELLRTRQVTSVQLTELALARLERLDPHLHCVVTLTRDRALRQARQADVEIAAGRNRGPLHGIPWGAKDLLAVKGHPTTWGARGFETQSIDEDATVVRRLDAAGAVLVAKLSLGALAMGDRWFGGLTRNPWRLEQGSSGSSAGSAAAVAAGCVPFAIGSETLGSISSPVTRCGVTGLRPTFGRVPRTGAMALSWTMDKLGPIARSAEDCALVLEAIAGADGLDRSASGGAFAWDALRDMKGIRFGALAPPADAAPGVRDAHRLALETLAGEGPSVSEVQLPDLPWAAMIQMLLAEAAAAFDDLTRSGRDRLLDGQDPDDWPNLFRAARLVPAVEYVQAARARSLGMEAMARIFADVDVVLAPTQGMQLVATNLTGHPALILPAGFRPADAAPPEDEDDGGGPGTPFSLTLIGGLDREADLCAAARRFQAGTNFHLARPPLPG